MKLAVNFSPQALKLLMDGEIDVDLWKCPDWHSLVEAAAKTPRPLYVHFDLNAGNPDMGDAGWHQIQDFLEQTNTPHVNLHLDVKPALVQGHDPWPFTHDVFTENIRKLGERFGIERVIAENVAYLDPDRGCHPVCTEASLIRDVIRETGCGLLLDTAHALLTSRHLGWDVRQYISSLPLDRLKEVHVTGTAPSQAKHMDSLPMRDEDWALFDWLVARIRSGEAAEPWVVAFEYGGVGPLFKWRSDPAVLREQVPILRNKLGERYRGEIT